MSETKRYRKFTAAQKTEIVLASLRGNKTITELCREHDIADSLLRKWREQFLAAGAERLSGKTERTEADELRRQISRLERSWPDAAASLREGMAETLTLMGQGIYGNLAKTLSSTTRATR